MYPSTPSSDRTSLHHHSFFVHCNIYFVFVYVYHNMHHV
nr:MAG TPA: hypothetical protein [Caudoviricetes sp.]